MPVHNRAYANRGPALARYHPPCDPRTAVPANYNHWPVRYRQVYAQSRYPRINAILAEDTTLIQYDVRRAPSCSLLLMVPQLGRTLALPSPSSAIHIVSSEFPWSLDIPAPVTCAAVFEGLYDMLQKPMTDSEWGSVVFGKSRYWTILAAAKARAETDGVMKLKRIDWLGNMTAFKGLEKNPEFESTRRMPWMAPGPETWVVRFGTPY
ncbi:hypothetical protein EDC04DRAFT_1459517 [Pisolithus marmoratus]|nr:hypothetical protein EDC04DRAFT_1459517 [Pisolithus marmoratus]